MKATCKQQQKDYLKWAPKPSYMSYKIFDNDVVATHKKKVTNLHTLECVFWIK